MSLQQIGFGKSTDRKIVDAFLFNDEIELLEFRLRYLSSVVSDVWIVESPNTFAGKYKGLVAAENLRQLSDKTKAKISLLNYPSPSSSTRWENEWIARRTILEHAKTLSHSDILLVSDLDEIPSVEQIEFIANEGGIWQLATPEYLRRLNWLSNVGSRLSIIGGNSTELLDFLSMERIDKSHVDYGVLPMANGKPGAHFSYLGFTAEHLKSKLSSFSHSEYDRPEVSNSNLLTLADLCLVDHIGRLHLKGFGLLLPILPPSLNGINEAAASGPLSWVGTTELPSPHIRLAAASHIFGIVQRRRISHARYLPSHDMGAHSWWKTLPIRFKMVLASQIGEALLIRLVNWVRKPIS